MANKVIDKNSVRYIFRNFAFKSNYEMFSLARKGITTLVLSDFAEAIKMSEKNLASLINLSGHTLSKYKKNKKLLELLYCERLLRLITLYQKGEEVFGNIDGFNYWLSKPFWKSDEKPIDWLNTPFGVDMVMEEMDRLAEGYPA